MNEFKKKQLQQVFRWYMRLFNLTEEESAHAMSGAGYDDEEIEAAKHA